MILIGSRALALRAPALLRRQPKDFDFVCTMDEFEAWLRDNQNKLDIVSVYPECNDTKMIVAGVGTNCEFEIVRPGTSAALFDEAVRECPHTIKTPFGLVPGLDMLFTLKASHRYLKNSPFFWKTLFDYHAMKRAGARVLCAYLDFFELREQETYAYKHPSLNQGKATFFADDQVKYVYDHDDIHMSVAMFARPAYQNYLKDGAEVACDRKKFEALPLVFRLAGVVEEAAVLAIERSLVPHPGAMDSRKAWFYALSKVCSSITSGWFREFAYDHALEVIKLYPENYWMKFQGDVASGLVRRVEAAS